MTRKDYVLIAGALHESRVDPRGRDAGQLELDA